MKLKLQTVIESFFFLLENLIKSFPSYIFDSWNELIGIFYITIESYTFAQCWCLWSEISSHNITLAVKWKGLSFLLVLCYVRFRFYLLKCFNAWNIRSKMNRLLNKKYKDKCCLFSSTSNLFRSPGPGQKDRVLVLSRNWSESQPGVLAGTALDCRRLLLTRSQLSQV